MKKDPDTSNMIPMRIPSSQSTQFQASFESSDFKPTFFNYVHYRVKPWMLITLLLTIIGFWVSSNFQFFQHQLLIKKTTLSQSLIEAVRNLEMPTKYIDIEIIQNHKELPICIVIDQQKWEKEPSFKESIQKQGYLSLQIALFNFQDEKEEKENATNSYDQLKKKLESECKQKSILFFMTSPLADGALKKLNDYYQTYNAWMLYDIDFEDQDSKQLTKWESKKINRIEVISVYRRVFGFIRSNDFWKMNRKLFEKPWDPLFVMTSLFQLCKYYGLSTPVKTFFQSSELTSSHFKYLVDQNNQESKYRRIPYQSLHSLTQNYQIQSIKALNQKRQLFFKSNQTLTQKAFIFNRPSLTEHIDVERALQYEQLVYLPDQHSLNLLEIERKDKLYKTGKYSSKELPLCINICSRNNIQNERYKKVLDSVMAQNYSNYQIAFIDDLSSDDTLVETKKYLENVLSFPASRVSYIRNKVHLFATYNIINAAFSLCKKESVVVLVDGDDQLIGKQVFKMISAEYQENDLWVMYTFYKNDKYNEGISIPFLPEYEHGFFGGRKLIYYFGHIKTFRTDLIRAVPISQHLNEVGNFLDTMYDTAFQYPFFEMSGTNHSKFVKQISYLYYAGYGANDDSNIFKSLRRTALHIWISFRPALNRINSLEEVSEDKDTRRAMDEGRGTKWEQIE